MDLNSRWIEAAIGLVAGFLIGIFAMGFVEPGWASDVEQWAPALAPAVAILIAATAVWHGEATRRRDRMEDRRAFVPFVAREIDSTVMSAIAFAQAMPSAEKPWTDTKEVQLALWDLHRVASFGNADRRTIPYADKMGILGQDAADLVYRTHALIHGGAMDTMRYCVAQGAMPSVDTFDVYRRAVGGAVVMRACLAGAIFGDVKFDASSRDDIADTIKILGLAATGTPRDDLRMIAEHCGVLSWFDDWVSTFAE